MNYTIKLIIFKLLSLFPNRLSYFLYHSAQKLIPRNKITHKINSSSNSYQIAKTILEKKNVTISNKNLLEIGSGLGPIMPYYFVFYSNVKKVITFDNHKHYDFITITKLNSYFKNKLNVNLPINKTSKNHLPHFLKYHPFTNLANTKCLSNETIDFIFSRNTLEHIPPNDIYRIHENFSKQLSHSYYVLHMISPSDHRAYSDTTISYHDFLQFSPEEWNSKQTKFDYHNRLRLPQYLKIFNDLNYEIIHLEYDKCTSDSEKYKRFKSLKLHKDFESFTDEENLAGSINILLKKSV